MVEIANVISTELVLHCPAYEISRTDCGGKLVPDSKKDLLKCQRCGRKMPECLVLKCQRCGRKMPKCLATELNNGLRSCSITRNGLEARLHEIVVYNSQLVD